MSICLIIEIAQQLLSDLVWKVHNRENLVPWQLLFNRSRAGMLLRLYAPLSGHPSRSLRSGTGSSPLTSALRSCRWPFASRAIPLSLRLRGPGALHSACGLGTHKPALSAKERCTLHVSRLEHLRKNSSGAGVWTFFISSPVILYKYSILSFHESRWADVPRE